MISVLPLGAHDRLSSFVVAIMKTCPCDLYPLTHHFYIVKLGFTGVYISFLFLLQNIDYG